MVGEKRTEKTQRGLIRKEYRDWLKCEMAHIIEEEESDTLTN